MMKATPSDSVRLLEADPDLGGLLTGTRREEAERELVVRVHRLGVGVWDISRLEGAGADHVGLLLLDGDAGEALPQFIEAIAKHRHFEREMDPPAV